MLGASKGTTTREYQLLDTGTITSTGSQSYVIPAGTFYLEVEMWGGGGGGGAKETIGVGRGAAHYSGGGGGGGAYLKKTYYGASDMQASDTLNFSVGAGGAGGAVSNAGMAGADTTLDTHKRSSTTITTFSSVEAGGASGGAIAIEGGDLTANGGAGGIAINGDINTSGNAGSDVTSADVGGAGGAGASGGGGGAGAVTSTDALVGFQPGGGGGGGRNGGMGTVRLGADGAPGKVVVKAYG